MQGIIQPKRRSSKFLRWVYRRHNYGFKPEDMAEVLDVHPVVIQHIERGDAHLLKRKELNAVFDKLAIRSEGIRGEVQKKIVGLTSYVPA